MLGGVPWVRSAVMRLPWRTVAVSWPLLAPWLAIPVGLGKVATVGVVACAIFVFAVPLTAMTSLEEYYLAPHWARLVGRARRLATAAVALAAAVSPLLGVGGAGTLIIHGLQTASPAQALAGYLQVLLLSGIIDLLLESARMVAALTSKTAVPRGADGQH
jgi:hypothetical protein